MTCEPAGRLDRANRVERQCGTTRTGTTRTAVRAVETARDGSVEQSFLGGVDLAPEQMRKVLRNEGERFVVAARNAPACASVAGVSGRTVQQTVHHLGDLCTDTLEWLGCPRAPDGHEIGVEETGMTVFVERFAARLADLLAEFGTRSPWETCATWWPSDATIRFWLRRMMHAITVHRVDAQTAEGVAVTPISEEVAEDGVAEVMCAWVGHVLSSLSVGGAHSSVVEVRTPWQRWLTCVDRERVAVREIAEESPSVDACVSGDAALIYLWLWGRLPDRAVRITGDVHASAQLWGLLRVAMR